jgi:hypothetical protein
MKLQGDLKKNVAIGVRDGEIGGDPVVVAAPVSGAEIKPGV